MLQRQQKQQTACLFSPNMMVKDPNQDSGAMMNEALLNRFLRDDSSGYTEEIDDDDTASVFHFEPMRLRFTDDEDEDSAMFTPKAPKIFMNNSPQLEPEQDDQETLSICNLDLLFGSESNLFHSFQVNDQKKHNLNDQFSKIMSKGPRTRKKCRTYSLLCDDGDHFTNDRVKLFDNDPWEPLIQLDTCNNNEQVYCQGDLFEEEPDWNLDKFFYKYPWKRCSSIKRTKKDHECIQDLESYTEDCLVKLFSENSILHSPIRGSSPCSSIKSSDSFDSCCLDSGIGSLEDHQNEQEKFDSSAIHSYSTTKKFWQQYYREIDKTKKESLNSMMQLNFKDTIKKSPVWAERNLPVEKNSTVDLTYKYEILSNLKPAPIGESERYLNEFELTMRKYCPELEQQNDPSVLMLLMKGLPPELGWLSTWIRSYSQVNKHKSFDFCQIKAIILNEEQAFLRRNIKNMYNHEYFDDQIRQVRSCPLELSRDTKNKQVDDKAKMIKFSFEEPPIDCHQRRWSISVDKHMQLVQFYRDQLNQSANRERNFRRSNPQIDF